MADAVVIGAREASLSLRARATAIRVGLPQVVRRGADSAVRLARHKSTAIMGENSGQRSGALQRAVQRTNVERFEVAGDRYYRCKVWIKPQISRSAYYGRLADPSDYAYFVEHGTKPKVATGHAGFRVVGETEKEDPKASFRGNLMVFRESRPGANRSRWYSGHFFRGQRGKHFMAGAADEVNAVIVPQLLRGFGLT